MTNYEKLRALADWFDLYDQKNPTHQIDENQIQIDLRAMATEFEQLNKPVVSGKLTDEEIWQWVEWIDKRCNFNDHQKDYVWFAIRQILKTNSACAIGALEKGVSEGLNRCTCDSDMERYRCRKEWCTR